MVSTHVLGFPRIGAQRELKFALEAFWQANASSQPAAEAALQETGRQLRQRHWQIQKDAGLSWVTVGDFAWYDNMLNLCATLGALPDRFGFDARSLTLAQYFELARGNVEQPAMEMTKWFDTNYHYLVPELSPATRFDGGVDWLLQDVAEAQALGLPVKVVLIGPVTFLYLAKTHAVGFDRLSLLPALVAAYGRILAQLKARGVQWVQLDEPVLSLQLDAAWQAAFAPAYAELAEHAPAILLASYFDTAADHAVLASQLPVQGFHIDCVRAPQQLDVWRQVLPPQALLSVGVVDGRNIWRADLRKTLAGLASWRAELGDRLWVASSCSLLHVPVSLQSEHKLDDEIQSWLAFAYEKVHEVAALGRGLSEGPAAIQIQLDASDAAQQSRSQSQRVRNAVVQKRLAHVTDAMADRGRPFAQRALVQKEALSLPLLPTTTIGSFPQTAEIRRARAAFKRGELSAMDYLQHMRDEIARAVHEQEALGLDVLVHGEAERNDMVEYFGEQLWGYAFTENGWVQSYGSRCVKPPIIYGDVFRPEPITVETARYAQSLTDLPMKGMLTGPVTMLQWSFVRDDQPRATTALQLALAIREEVADLEKAGIRIIQIDEPAFREGLPLRRSDWEAYLAWAVKAFKISAACVRDDTQIHTHMCYSEFNDILPAIAAMDADVITIETSRSAMALLDGFGAFDYPNEIGPGVYDIHSPRLPSVEAMVRLLERACQVIPVDRLWVNPDCGLKTRGWPEVKEALARMVQAAQILRDRWGQQALAA
ncbi:MAG: 5-methyltetrahydropteroyltriglutamate--homocysteine S-methyltransferase [Acidobacteriota bacterium]